MPVKGIKEVQRNYQKTVNNIARDKVERVLTKVGVVASGYSKSFAPVEYKTLVNSQYQEVTTTASGMRLEVGYVTDYAAALELRRDWKPRPVAEKAGPAWNPNAKPGFLQAGFEDSQPAAAIDRIVIDGMKV